MAIASDGWIRSRFGFWRYFAVRSGHRTQLRLEQQRHRATLQVIQGLPDDFRFLDYTPGERLIVIAEPSSGHPLEITLGPGPYWRQP